MSDLKDKIGWTILLFIPILLFVACEQATIATKSVRPTIINSPTTTVSPEALNNRSTSSFPTTVTSTPVTTSTSSPIPTSEVIPGWRVYTNDFYGYHFSYPPQATIGTQGVSGFPSDELPADMTSAEYRRQLEETYPEDICVNVSYQSAFVVFIAPQESGGKYAAPCGVSGVGAYDIIPITETLTIDGYPYTASGYTVRPRDETETWRGEFLSVQLGDGVSIQYGGGLDGDVSYEEYQATKETLLQVIASFHSPATSQPIPTATPTPISGQVAMAAGISVGDWSVDGRYLTYWRHTSSDLQASSPFPSGDFHVYDAVQEQNCSFSGYPSRSTIRERRHLWLPNNNILVFGDEEILSISPCTDTIENLTNHFPEPITQVITGSQDHTQFLLDSETGYWLYQPAGHVVHPVSGLNEEIPYSAAFSPDGRFVALNGDNGDSYLLDTNTAQANQIATWPIPQRSSSVAAPTWVDNERFLLRASQDQGPLLIGVDGTVQNVGEAFFDQPATPTHNALVGRNEANDQFVILLYNAGSVGSSPMLQLYYSAADVTQSLSVAPPLNQVTPTLSPGGRWLILYDPGQEEAGSANELWVRSVATTVSDLSPLFESENEIIYRFAPHDAYVALSVGNFIRIASPASGDSVQSQGYGSYRVIPEAWSPDGQYLALLGQRDGEENQGLFVLAVAPTP